MTAAPLRSLSVAPDLPDGSRVLTYAEVAALIRARTGRDVDETTLRAYRARGQMPQGHKVGATRVFTPAEIDAWLAERPGQGTRTDLKD